MDVLQPPATTLPLACKCVSLKRLSSVQYAGRGTPRPSIAFRSSVKASRVECVFFRENAGSLFRECASRRDAPLRGVWPAAVSTRLRADRLSMCFCFGVEFESVRRFQIPGHVPTGKKSVTRDGFLTLSAERHPGTQVLGRS